MAVMIDYDIEILNSLNFAYAPPCEILWHEDFGEGPAELIIDIVCECGQCKRKLSCRKCTDVALKATLQCRDCGKIDPGRECWRIVGYV